MADIKRLYVAVFLDEESKAKLLKAAPPKHVNVYGEHLTLAFGRHMKEIYPIGEVMHLKVRSVREDDRGQAVVIERSNELHDWLWAEQTPHITISCAVGIKPVYSNELLKLQIGDGSSWKDRMFDLELSGVVDWFPRTSKEIPNEAVPVPNVG